jgi:hypothetical protein
LNLERQEKQKAELARHDKIQIQLYHLQEKQKVQLQILKRKVSQELAVQKTIIKSQ